MAEYSGFFDAMEINGVYDRVYSADDFAKYFAMFIGNGVFINPANQLKVVAKSGLTVTVKKGEAFIDGFRYELDEDMDITLNPNTTAYTIQSVICCTLNKAERKITTVKKDAVSSILPVNNGSTHELVLANISIGAGVSTITNSMITDRRPYSNYCGFVEGLIDQINMDDLFLQFESEFNEWFATVQNSLSDDVAGSLQLQIQQLRNDMPVIRYGTNPPDNTVGEDGDIYIQIVGGDV